MNSTNCSPFCCGRGAGMRGLALPEVLFIVGQGERFALDGLPVRAALDNQEFAEVASR